MPAPQSQVRPPGSSGTPSVGDARTEDAAGLIAEGSLYSRAQRSLREGIMPVTRIAGRGVGRLLLLALAAGGVILGPAPARPQPAPGATAGEREAGRREGQVTYYTARTTTTANTIARKASEALGIKVHIVRLASTLIF